MKATWEMTKEGSTTKLVLEEVVGQTPRSANSLAGNLYTGDCIYLAGCVIVVYSFDLKSQSHLMMSSRNPKPLNCVAICQQDGRFIAAGESGDQAAVLIWDLTTQSLMYELMNHRWGVSCIDFSRDGKYLVSVGFPNDGNMCLWDWRNGKLIAKLMTHTIASAILSVKFSSDGSFIVTAGKKHLKIWTMATSTKYRSNVGPILLPKDGRTAVLGCQKGSSFVSIVTSTRARFNRLSKDQTNDLCSIYALTDKGVLCLLYSGFVIRKWVALKVDKSFALTVSDKLIACACSNGIVQLLNVESLKYIGALQYYEVNENQGATKVAFHTKLSKDGFKLSGSFPDAICCQFSAADRLVVIYEDHSLYVWDVHNLPEVSWYCVQVSHTACIWDVENILSKNIHDTSLACIPNGSCSGVPFATCSADGAIRLWDIMSVSPPGSQKRNIDLDNRLQISSTNNLQVEYSHVVSIGTFEKDANSKLVSKGFHCMAVSPDGKYLVSGDFNGNLHVYNMHTSEYTCFQAVHDGEILSLSFYGNHVNTVEKAGNPVLLASGGRDQMIHIYEVERDFNVIQSLSGHTATVTSVKFSCGEKFLSCDANGSLQIHDLIRTNTGCKIIYRHQITFKGAIFDLVVDPVTDSAITVGQDNKINIFNISSGSLVTTFEQDCEIGETIKAAIDPSGSYLVCSHSSKSISIYELNSGDLITQAMGHSEVVTGVIFSLDCKHLISVGGDGCIFVWKLPTVVSTTMLQKIMNNPAPLSCKGSPPSIIPKSISIVDNNMKNKDFSDVSIFNESIQDELLFQEEKSEAQLFRFSVSRLPVWAQSEVTNEQDAIGNIPNILSKEILDNNETYYRRVCPEVSSPTQVTFEGNSNSLTDMIETPCTTDADDSSTNQDNKRRKDEHWNTIHTVYLDLMYSPEGVELKDYNAKNLTPKTYDQCCRPDLLLKCSKKEEKSINRTKPSSIDQENTIMNTVKNEDQSELRMEELCCETPQHSRNVQIHEEMKDIHEQTGSGDGSSQNQYQVDDLFIQHFSKLSSGAKMGKGSSERRSYSARFVVRRDPQTGYKKIFEITESPGIQAPNILNKDAPGCPSEDLSIQLPTEREVTSVDNQDAKIQNSVLSSHIHNPSDADKLTFRTNIEEEEENQQVVEDKIGSTTPESVSEYKEALLDLNNAASKTLQLFIKCKSQMAYKEVTEVMEEILPSIIEKVQTLAALMETNKVNSLLTNGLYDLSLEPLISRYAENLSTRVLDLVQKKLG